MIDKKGFIVNLIRENKKSIFWVVFVATIGSLFAAVVPYVYGRLFDLVIIPNSELNIVLSLILLWFVLSIISNYTSNKTSEKGDYLAVKVSLDSEAKAYSQFIHLPIPYHKSQRRGEVLQKISRASWNLQRIVEVFSSVLPQFLILTFSLVAMFLIRWELGLILIFSFAVYSAVTVKKTKKLMKLHEKEDKVYEKQYGKVYDKLYNIFIVKNFAMEKIERENIRKGFIGKLLPYSKKAITGSSSLSLIQDVIYTVSFVSILGFAILFLRAGNLTPGQFIMFFGYASLAFAPFRHIAGVYRNFKRATIGVKRLVKLENLVPEEMKHGDKKLQNPRGEITFEDLSFKYPKGKEVLEDINLEIKPGETVALVGKSGVGKTTLSELIMGYYRPEKGTIKIDGVEISKLKLLWLRDQIAVVPQDLNLFNDTLINNLKYANPKATKEKIVEAAKAASAHEFIKKFPKGYNTLVGEEGLRLSMGQKQRIALAMAFLKNPRILILDEPTSSLDAESEEEVRKGINKLIRGRTTIIIAHRFSTVRKAHKIVVLDKRKIAEVGTHRELMERKGIYYKLYSLQKGIA